MLENKLFRAAPVRLFCLIQIRESMQDAGADVFVCGLLDEVRLSPIIMSRFVVLVNICAPAPVLLCCIVPDTAIRIEMGNCRKSSERQCHAVFGFRRRS